MIILHRTNIQITSHNKLTNSKKKWHLILNKNIVLKEFKMASKVAITILKD